MIDYYKYVFAKVNVQVPLGGARETAAWRIARRSAAAWQDV